VNSVVKQNISRLDTDRYMSLCVARLDGARITFAGKHQDVLIWRSATRSVETLPTTGTWLGIVDDLAGKLDDHAVEIAEGDAVLLFTDGITEAMNAEGDMFGQDRLTAVLQKHGQLEAEQIVLAVLAEVEAFQADQADDITLLVLKRVQTGRRADS
jgi:serine phosphatase RsbU (regulator of sigma subunit)